MKALEDAQTLLKELAPLGHRLLRAPKSLLNERQRYPVDVNDPKASTQASLMLRKMSRRRWGTSSEGLWTPSLPAGHVKRVLKSFEGSFQVRHVDFGSRDPSSEDGLHREARWPQGA